MCHRRSAHRINYLFPLPFVLVQFNSLSSKRLDSVIVMGWVYLFFCCRCLFHVGFHAGIKKLFIMTFSLWASTPASFLLLSMLFIVLSSTILPFISLFSPFVEQVLPDIGYCVIEANIVLCTSWWNASEKWYLNVVFFFVL